MKKIILGLFLAFSVQAADQKTKYFEQAKACNKGDLTSCKLIEDACAQGTDWACAWRGYFVLKEQENYKEAKAWLAKGCDAGGKWSCDLLNFLPNEILKDCAAGKQKACDGYKSL